MIGSFKHKGLKRLYEKGDPCGIRPDLVVRIEGILSLLDVAEEPEALALPAYKLHKLSGNLKGYWSVTVRANWRIIFRFAGQHVFDVQLIDYH